MNTFVSKLCVGFMTAAALAAFAPAFAQDASPSDAAASAGEDVSGPRARVLEMIESLGSGNTGPAAYIDPDRYVQHNLQVADGLQGFLGLVAAAKAGNVRADVVRVFQDGDYVFTHTDYEFFGPRIGFDVFRFENGLIVEHWDNLQRTAGPNPSGRTMIDGPVEATDLDRTDANKALVRAFMEEVLIGGQADKIGQFINEANYLQHNPHFGDGVTGLRRSISAGQMNGVPIRYTTVHRVLGQGDFVLVMGEGVVGGAATAFYDLFRVASGKLVEHWDTVETIPLRDQWKNDNGKF